MGNKWTECELGVFIELKRGYDLPKSARNEGSIPIISSSGFTDYNDKPMVKGPGVVTGRYGTIGEVFYSEEDFWPLNTTLYVVDFKGNDPLFVYYLLQTISYADYTDKAAVPGINRNHLHKAKVKVPISLEIQQKVAAQLYQLEKRVTLGKQINQTLEQMSQTVFKSWFVDFDPVIDNALDAGNPIPEALQSRAEMRQKVRKSADFKPLPADIRALFPAEFEEAESGWVPMGWKDGSLPDIAFINPTSWGTKNQPNYVNYVDLSNAKDGIISSIDKISFKEAPSRARRILKKDDLIFGLVRPANRSFAYVHIDGLTGSTGFAVIRAKNTIYKNFIYYFVTYDKNVEELARIADGGAYPAIKPDDICSLPLIIPSEEIVQRFDELTSNFRYLMNNSLVQNDFLTALRDTLLPKLISGELPLEDLPDLIKQTEAA
ncbi:restriction endonuclease subunit S [Enterobacter hormaechei]|uniref:Restriction endonuclease subunit S n=3 Tax=Enterobacter TaxID=547 RepID=A0ABV1Z944_9ENTR|nr:restriction endonuclease subunit S [Enterobacter hormaechei]MBS6211346.1 restriction endonuclease subunit S [Proteus hauseri]QLU70345.1 restriction endonuclease subunit S [Enterobacter cloacae]QLU90564.1 restriction endonuclease subunit S [Enterobacter roggenkampii]HCJ6302700.1 restriction endonuclease subunit S [Enterobacter hormaechei subsp. xiangfangensis]HED2451511.1 restriction endonuclease subunit S [Enterobacter hormaechei subsp. hoffmannii]